MEHRTKTIARTRTTRVDQCTCGAVHITVGGTTVRVPESAARELKDALVRGIEAIDAETVSAPSRGFRVVLPDDDDPDGKLH